MTITILGVSMRQKKHIKYISKYFFIPNENISGTRNLRNLRNPRNHRNIGKLMRWVDYRYVC